MKNRQKVIAFMMAVVFLIWVSNSLKKPVKAKGMTQPLLASTSQQEVKTDKKTNPDKAIPEVDLREVITYIHMKYDEPKDQALTDPFEILDPRIVLDTTAGDFSELELSGIIWEEKEPMALINDQILKNGDMISGFKISDIRRNEVVLIKGLERYILKLANPLKEEPK